MTCLRRRGLIAAVAVCLLLWQSLATGIVAAESAALAASGFGAGVICHSDGGSVDPAKDGGHGQDCCVWCAATAAPPLPGPASAALRLKLASAAKVLAMHVSPPAIVPRAVRAGFSQAPPSLV